MDKAALRTMSVALGAELRHLDTPVEEMEIARQEGSPLARRSMGSILHDFYTCCERVFRRVAVELNGGLDESEQWHKSLLPLSLERIRPAVISEELAAELDEYLAFRHVFRNIYGFELKGERIIRLSERLSTVAASFKKEINDFRGLLESEIRNSSP